VIDVSEQEHPLVASLYDAVMALPERYVLGAHREFLAADASGRVLDIGAGTGGQFEAFASRADDVTALHAVEPDPHMRQRAVGQAAGLDLSVSLVGADAESLPYRDDSFDLVVASLVFCTIPDPGAALDEVARVLSPGGEFRFLEHVRAHGTTGRLHDLAAPCWRAVAGGCHLNRRTGDRFQRDDRFDLLEFDRFEAGAGRALPLVRGRMRRRDDPALLSRVFG